MSASGTLTPLHRRRCDSTVLFFDSTMARCTGTPGWSTSTSGAPASRGANSGSHTHCATFRLADLFCPGEVVVDLMAGIGPFAIPAARRRVTVHANDLNPQCAHYLRINVRANKVSRSGRVRYSAASEPSRTFRLTTACMFTTRHVSNLLWARACMR